MMLSDLEDTLILRAGESKAIEIPFSAHPMPTVTWKYNEGAMPDKRRMKEETIRGMTSLMLTKVIRKDSGKYTLTMQNTHGKASHTIKVIVLDKPAAPEEFKVTGVSEDTVALSWMPPEDDGGSEITQYILERREANMRQWQVWVDINFFI